MTYKGYTNRLLQVDLAERTVTERAVPGQMAEGYIGGVGFAAALIDDMVRGHTGPFAP